MITNLNRKEVEAIVRKFFKDHGSNDIYEILSDTSDRRSVFVGFEVHHEDGVDVDFAALVREQTT